MSQVPIAPQPLSVPKQAPVPDRSRLTHLRLDGFRSIRQQELELSDLTVLIGANGSGKSNLLSVFPLLNALTTQGLRAFVSTHGGADALLYLGRKRTPVMSLGLGVETSRGSNRYEFRLGGGARDVLVFLEESVSFRDSTPGRPPLHYDLGVGHVETQLADCIDQGRPGHMTAQVVKFALDRFRHFHFHDTTASAAVKQTAAVPDVSFLRGDGGNLAPFLRHLRGWHPDSYRLIREAVRRILPRFDDFVLEPTEHATSGLLLEWRQTGSDYVLSADQLSDGSLRFICLATLLLQPFDRAASPFLMVIDEPELGLHPAAITLLAALIRQASAKAQVVVSTQSPLLLDAIDSVESTVVVESTSDGSTFSRRTQAELAPWLEDYSLGELWQKNLLGGRP